jgi:hypothetical protein
MSRPKRSINTYEVSGYNQGYLEIGNIINVSSKSGKLASASPLAEYRDKDKLKNAIKNSLHITQKSESTEYVILGEPDGSSFLYPPKSKEDIIKIGQENVGALANCFVGMFITKNDDKFTFNIHDIKSSRPKDENFIKLPKIIEAIIVLYNERSISDSTARGSGDVQPMKLPKHEEKVAYIEKIIVSNIVNPRANLYLACVKNLKLTVESFRAIMECDNEAEKEFFEEQISDESRAQIYLGTCNFGDINLRKCYDDNEYLPKNDRFPEQGNEKNIHMQVEILPNDYNNGKNFNNLCVPLLRLQKDVANELKCLGIAENIIITNEVSSINSQINCEEGTKYPEDFEIFS